MAGRAILATFCILLALSGIGFARSVVEEQEQNESSFGLLLESNANIDNLFDQFLPLIQKLMLENGMDPMELPDHEDHLLPLPGKLKGNLKLTDGWIQELSRLRRSKHIQVTYDKKILKLDMNLRWDRLDANYRYEMKCLLFKRTGDANGRFKDLDARVMVTVDLENYLISVDSLKFSRVGDFKLNFEGNIFDPIVTAISRGITKIFKSSVLDSVEEMSLTIFRKVVADLNEQIPRPPRPNPVPLVIYH